MPTWTTRAGQEIDIDQMETSHILSALNMRLRQMAQLDLDSRDAQQDFADDFGMDTRLAEAVGLCRKEFAEIEKYTLDIGNLAAELGKRKCQLMIKSKEKN